MRKFIIINAKGEEWNLNESGSFLAEPSGLGQEHKVKYEQIGNNFIKLEDLLEQKAINGTIHFSNYSKFLEFSLFIQHKPLTLEYTAADTYQIDISIDSLGKSELETGGLLSPIRIKGLSAYYKVVRSENSGSGSDGKVYPYSYPYKYADYSSGSVEVISDSAIEGSVKITVLGPCTNPSWTHYLNGEIKTTGKVNCTIPDGHRLVVDNTKIPFEIAEYDSTGSFVQSLYQQSDFSTKRFPNLGFGNNKLSFTHEGDTVLSIIAEGRVNYESV